MEIPKIKIMSREFNDIEEIRNQESLMHNLIKENCPCCSICGGIPVLVINRNFWEVRIHCENYKGKGHGNFYENKENRRVTNWKTGEDNLKEAIQEWTEINN